MHHFHLWKHVNIKLWHEKVNQVRVHGTCGRKLCVCGLLNVAYYGAGGQPHQSAVSINRSTKFALVRRGGEHVVN